MTCGFASVSARAFSLFPFPCLDHAGRGAQAAAGQRAGSGEAPAAVGCESADSGLLVGWMSAPGDFVQAWREASSAPTTAFSGCLRTTPKKPGPAKPLRSRRSPDYSP